MQHTVAFWKVLLRLDGFTLWWSGKNYDLLVTNLETAIQENINLLVLMMTDVFNCAFKWCGNKQLLEFSASQYFFFKERNKFSKWLSTLTLISSLWCRHTWIKPVSVIKRDVLFLNLGQGFIETTKCSCVQFTVYGSRWISGSKQWRCWVLILGGKCRFISESVHRCLWLRD